MFKKAILAKFEWDGLPEPLTDLFVENLIYSSSDNNFAVVFLPGADGKPAREFWSLYNVLQSEPNYGIPTRIVVTPNRGGSFETEDFCLFSQFRTPTTPEMLYVEAHTQIIKMINKALIQHITASELIGTIYANSNEEAKDLEKYYKRFPGIKIVKPKSGISALDAPVNFIQFEITPRTAELEQLKHDLENDLFLRIGIYTGTDKTHVTNYEVESSEQVVDLINSYQDKRRQDFCARYNEWIKRHGETRTLSCRIHKISADNTIEKTTTTTTETEVEE